jgi:hypothetical protein
MCVRLLNQVGLVAALMATAPGFHAAHIGARADIAANRGGCPMARSQTAGGAHGPTWPSVEQQLADSKAIHGSALEKLIRDNQQLEMLRPEEANDKARLPPWIRIYWRKRHPEGKYIGPSGGYPLTLQQLYDWMIAHQDLPGLDAPNPSDRPSTGGRRGN